MSKVAQRLPAAPQANRVSTSIHGNPLLSTGFAVSFAVKGDGKKAGVSVFGDLRTKKKSRNPCWLGLFLFSRMTPGTLASRQVAHVGVNDQGQWFYTRICAARSCCRCSGEDSRG